MKKRLYLFILMILSLTLFNQANAAAFKSYRQQYPQKKGGASNKQKEGTQVKKTGAADKRSQSAKTITVPPGPAATGSTPSTTDIHIKTSGSIVAGKKAVKKPATVKKKSDGGAGARGGK